MAMEIFDVTIDRLQQGIDRATRKQAVIAQNIANINNPNYNALEFDAILNKAVKRANRKVILEEEMDALARNSSEHSALVKLYASKMNILHTVVTQGKR